MGLDQYIYRVTKPTEEEIARINQGDATGFYEITLSSPADEELVSLIKDFIYLKDKDVSYYVPDKIKKFFNIPENAVLCFVRSGGNKIIWSFKDKDNDKEYQVDPTSVKNQDEITEIQKVKIAYIKEDEIGYWRKDYKLQNKIHEACYHSVRNCGYYPINKDMMKILLKDKHNIFAREDLTSTDNVIVCYLEDY